MKKNKRLLAWLLPAVACALVLSGCSSAPDNVEDPLSNFGVNAQLPFSTAAPEALEPTPTPAPTAPWDTPAPTPAMTGVPGANAAYNELANGSSGEEVRKLQQRLKDLNYFSGSVDGNYGASTVVAVKLFQSKLGLDQTGAATETLQRLLYSSVAPTYTENYYDFPDDSGDDDTDDDDDSVAPSRPSGGSSSSSGTSSGYQRLARGSSGTAVKNLQSSLKYLGYYSGSVDGVYGSGTVKAVKLFEAAYGKPQTGIATEALQKKLYSGDAKRYNPPAADDDDDDFEEEDEYKTLEPGDSGAAVKRLQQRLKSLGYFTGDVGGNYLTQTTAAVKLFQKQAGLSQTGVATAALQKRIFASNAPAYTQSGEYVRLSRGDTGAWVTALQQRLKSLGYLEGSVDGVYGTATVNAVKRFEKAYGKSTTGVATVALQKKLFSDDAKPYEPEPTPKPTSAPAIDPDDYVTLKSGSTGVRVMTLQNRLLELGYFDGDVDGVYGTGTVKAVKRFEKAYGRDATGVATVALQKKLFADNAKPYEPDEPDDEVPDEQQTDYVKLSPGDTGERVKRLQRRLQELGYFDGDIGGNYLTKTENAVKLFEKAYGKKQTGVATVALQKVLFSDDAKPYKNSGSGGSTDKDEETTYKKLSPGDKGNAVKRLQQRLLELGYFDGEVAGNYLTKTTAAVKRFQKALGEDATGIATVSLQKKLFDSGAPSYEGDLSGSGSQSGTKTLAYGDKGSAVRKLQLRLIELGYLDDLTDDNDGVFDKKTRQAVIDAQLAMGEDSDGSADAAFQSFIFSDDAWSISLTERG